MLWKTSTYQHYNIEGGLIMDITTPEQLKEIQDSLTNAKPVPIAMTMHKGAFEWLIKAENILDQGAYIKDHGITILGDSAPLGKWKVKLIYSDKSTKDINLREETK